MTNSLGNIAAQISYDGFGNSGGSSLTRYDYTGRERDPDTGLIYYRARFYDPQVGRFISEDPIRFAGGLNWYAYVGNNAMVATDPLGLYPPSHPYCQRLRRRIAGLAREIAKRIGEMHEDKLGLDWREPGDTESPNLSRWGHQKIINMLKAKKDELEAMYEAKCNDREPPNDPTCPVPVPSRNPARRPNGPTMDELRMQEEPARQMEAFYGKVLLGDVAIGAVLLAPEGAAAAIIRWVSVGGRWVPVFAR